MDYYIRKKLFIILITISITMSINIVNAEKIKSNNYNEYSDSMIINSYFNQNEYYYRLFYIGGIKDLNIQENFISFDAVNLYRISFIRSSDWSFWEYSLSHYEETHHQHENYRFFGILRDNIILGIFFK